MSANDDKGNGSRDSSLSYFNLGSAINDVKSDFAHGDVSDKAKSSAKLAGKTLFNVGLFAGKLGFEAIKSTPQILTAYNNKTRELQLKYESLEDVELVRIINGKGFFKVEQRDKGVILGILRARGLSADEIDGKI